jgi:hypothetical protein
MPPRWRVKEDFRKEALSISQEDISSVSRNIVREYEVCFGSWSSASRSKLLSEQDKLNRSDKTDSNFSGDTGFISGEAPVTAAVLWGVTKRTSCIYTFVLFEIVTT